MKKSRSSDSSLKKKPTNRSKPRLDLTPSHNSMSLSSFSYRKLSIAAAMCLLVSVVFLLAVSSNTLVHIASSHRGVKYYTIDVVNEFPHDPNAFTQGLLYAGDDSLFESTGLNGKSSIRKVALQTGKVETLKKMDTSYFGEGLTLLGDRLFQLTWLSQSGFTYDRNNFNKFKKFTHDMKDGWGLATDGKILFGSDGSSALYHIDPRTMKAIRKQIVKFRANEVHNLNELEYIDGEVWANVWQTDCIARISPEDGSVIGWILLQNLREGLISSGNYGIDVLNGIAWDADKERLFVTGKLWPKLYEIKLKPVKKQVNEGPIENLCLRNPVHFNKP